ncbi:Short-chain dehydrogenase/reductase family protein [Mycena indigotica]|uniref:Short-chain dehydrogenase/reductase family protein n=1 Tax=Mycena indigotica TaxID=2126181 RepID=A0A8H6SFK5_9AGAR|nr:Short-chain dehydrogenase/reductase family protein [Mycena indigotica]KAF7298618.1 Short-chain dehydrogenase/reductase family protein [Mycena indigotica]
MTTTANQLPTFNAASTAEEVVDALASEIQGKNVLVTGTSVGGIGFETARAIAKLRLSKEAIQNEFPATEVRTLELDLSSLAAVRKAAAEVNAYPESIHVVINNAAATETVHGLTVDNLEIQMASGHIAPFLFTKLIFSKLLASADAAQGWTPRVVFVSSIQHNAGDGVPLEKEEFMRGNGGPDPNPAVRMFARYGAVKSANVLTAREMARRGGSKVRAYSLHPGAIITNAFSKGFKDALQQVGVIDHEGNPGTVVSFKTIPQGAATTVVAAFDPRIANHSGAYLEDGVLAEHNVAPHSADTRRAKKLWELTEEVIDEKFDL